MKKLFLASSLDMVADDIVKKLNTNQRKLVFITTASEAETGDKVWLEDDRKALVSAGFDVSDYTFTGKTAATIKNDLEKYEVISIEGGNTFYLLEQIQKSNCAGIVRQMVENGTPYLGSSAGSIIAGPDIYPVRHLDTDHFSELKDFAGLNLVDFIIFPHWGSDYFKELYLDRRMDYNYNDNHKYMLLTDNQYIEVQDDWQRIIDVKN